MSFRGSTSMSYILRNHIYRIDPYISGISYWQSRSHLRQKILSVTRTRSQYPMHLWVQPSAKGDHPPKWWPASQRSFTCTLMKSQSRSEHRFRIEARNLEDVSTRPWRVILSYCGCQEILSRVQSGVKNSYILSTYLFQVTIAKRYLYSILLRFMDHFILLDPGI